MNLDDLKRDRPVDQYDVDRQKLRLLHQIRLLHQRSQTLPFTCTEDGQEWPCETVRKLRRIRPKYLTRNEEEIGEG
ncbi:hypothetical protein BARRIGA_79 [Mycobacterium phage Barriga]|uniref:zinc-finger domain protein n=1 Tax=Mycobacterium phage Barriga TaxID=1675548 RepID=UPI0006A2D405|nr:zinc-finger domain protein [Mycobacterium phage Barriga]AKU44947.1 hypothetical protein BARRIGA_79 [Mycobacterium phage Barriga]